MAMMMTTMGMTDSPQMRHEEKYQISPQEDRLLSWRLSKLFRRDPHAEKSGSYRITSLYFDTPYDRILREKLNGKDRREKFRLRYYGMHPEFFRLEKKFKINGRCGKRSAQLSYEETVSLLAGKIDFLLDRQDPLLTELYSKLNGELLTPKTVVRYDREAFLYPVENVRITLDRQLRTCTNWKAFFAPDLCSLAPLEKITVLEVKYDAFLPELVRMAVQQLGRQSEACSKYALCRRFE